MSKGFNFLPFQAGKNLLDQLTAERLNAMCDAIDRCRPIAGDNMTSQSTPGGVILRGNSGGSSSQDPDITFFLSDATVTEGDPPETSNKVFVADGKINGEFPAGMGSSEYTLDLDNPSDSLIYAGATFDPESLALTSRFLGVSASGDFPESRVDEAGGFLYWLLGFTFFDANSDFRIVMTRLGNINFELTYGSRNGAPALLPVETGPGWLDLESLFPPTP